MFQFQTAAKYLANDAFAEQNGITTNLTELFIAETSYYTYKGTMPSNTSINVKTELSVFVADFITNQI